MTTLGVSLLVIGVVLIVLEAHVPTLGVLGVPGILAIAAGAVFGVVGIGGGILAGVLIAVVLVAVAGGLLAVSVRKGLAVQRRRVRAGAEGLIGHIGVVRSWEEAGGKVLVDGALWSARRSPGVELDDEDDAPPALHAGDPIVVERLSGLTLAVRRAEDWELTA